MVASGRSSDAYDVIIIGGALSGAATAILLLREHPQLRVLIVEKSEKFTRRVGEATVEISAYFIGRVLGLTQYLNETQLVKQGMRFWFQNEETETLEDCSEIGGLFLARVPAYQVDRSTLDQEILNRACACGAELLRPANVQRVDLVPGGSQVVTLKMGEETKTLSARWVVDGSGVAALLARQNGWLRQNKEHPTSAVWARWRGVKDWDGLELAKKFPHWSRACYGIRNTATNHLTGFGWWAWCIPLKGGDVSIGVVFDQRLVSWPEEGSLGERLKQFLSAHPAGKELLADATVVDGDVHWRKNLPYCSNVFAGDGFVLVGDAAGFLDPFYSPGMDWASFTAVAAAELISLQQAGASLQPLIARHNQTFAGSYERWFRGIYKNKYFYMGDYDLMRLSFIFDIGLYYLGVASQPYKRGYRALFEPVFSTRPSIPFYWLMKTYTARFAAMGQARYARGMWGKHNHGRRLMFPGYTFSPASSRPLLQALLGWGWLELTEGWRSWFKPLTVPTPAVPEIRTSATQTQLPASAPG